MKRNGFTFIELLIVVSIISILAAIAIPQFVYHRSKPVVAKLLSGEEMTKEEKELYANHKTVIDGIVERERKEDKGKPQQVKKPEPVPADSHQVVTPPVKTSDTVVAEAEKKAETEAVMSEVKKTEEQLQSLAKQAKSAAVAPTAGNLTSDADDLSKPIPPIPPID